MVGFPTMSTPNIQVPSGQDRRHSALPGLEENPTASTVVTAEQGSAAVAAVAAAAAAAA
jgi:hypothetical protein